MKAKQVDVIGELEHLFRGVLRQVQQHFEATLDRQQLDHHDRETILRQVILLYQQEMAKAKEGWEGVFAELSEHNLALTRDKKKLLDETLRQQSWHESEHTALEQQLAAAQQQNIMLLAAADDRRTQIEAELKTAHEHVAGLAREVQILRAIHTESQRVLVLLAAVPRERRPQWAEQRRRETTVRRQTACKHFDCLASEVAEWKQRFWERHARTPAADDLQQIHHLSAGLVASQDELASCIGELQALSVADGRLPDATLDARLHLMPTQSAGSNMAAWSPLPVPSNDKLGAMALMERLVVLRGRPEFSAAMSSPVGRQLAALLVSDEQGLQGERALRKRYILRQACSIMSFLSVWILLLFL